MCTDRAVLQILAFALVTVAIAEQQPSPAALGTDDECDVGSGDPSCTLNALQKRVAVEIDEPMQNMSLLEKPSYTAACFSYTGGTCVIGNCNEDRGASCVKGKCLCSGCAGADGKCHKESYQVVARDILLRNAKSKHFKMFFQRVSVFGQMKTINLPSFANLGKDRFDVYKIHGVNDGRHRYFLSSNKWKDYVVGIKATTGTALSPWGAYAVDLADKAKLTDFWGPNNMMLEICEMSSRSPYQGSLLIAAVMPTGRVYAYVHGGSLFVYGSMTRPGPGGMWKPDPPLPPTTFEPCPDN